MIREIIIIDEELCNGCGDCVPNCHEGALQIIDGKVRLVSELMCDGLGACLGHCHAGALSIEKRDVPEYDEVLVVKGIIPKGKNTLIAHLKHLKDHDERVYLRQAMDYLQSIKESLPFSLDEIKSAMHPAKPASPAIAFAQMPHTQHSGCPGSRAQDFALAPKPDTSHGSLQSQLSQWPIQLHLINPAMSSFEGADILVAADCVAFTCGDFHQTWLKDKKLAIACPKLDEGQQIYFDKIVRMIEEAKVNTITVMIMEVPCCGGLLGLVKKAAAAAKRKVPVKAVTVSIRGEILSENWL